MVLLDTKPMTVLEREGSEAELLKARLARIPQDDLATTIISYEEQTRGWLAYIAQIQTEEARIRAYRLLNRHLAACRRERISGRFRLIYGIYAVGLEQHYVRTRVIPVDIIVDRVSLRQAARR